MNSEQYDDEENYDNYGGYYQSSRNYKNDDYGDEEEDDFNNFSNRDQNVIYVKKEERKPIGFKRSLFLYFFNKLI